jgi:hypothetical protein
MPGQLALAHRVIRDYRVHAELSELALALCVVHCPDDHLFALLAGATYRLGVYQRVVQGATPRSARPTAARPRNIMCGVCSANQHAQSALVATLLR